MKKGAFALLFCPLQTRYKKLGQILDISKGGLAFRYTCMKKKRIEEKINGSSKLRIFGSDISFHISSFKVVYDFILPNQSWKDMQTRRCGIEFGPIAQRELTQLELLIQNHTIGEVSDESDYTHL